MSSLFPTIYLGTAAVQFFTSVTFFILARRSVLARAQASFGYVAFFLGLSSVVQYLEYQAADAYQAAIAQSFLGTMHVLSLLAFIPFCRAYLGGEPRKVRFVLAYLTGALAILPVLAGYAYDPSQPILSDSPILAGPYRPIVKMTPIGVASGFVGFISLMLAFNPGVFNMLKRSVGRELLAVMSITMSSYSIDFAHYLLELRAIPVAPIACAFFAFAGSALLLNRYLDVRSELERQTSILRVRYEQIARIETEIDRKEPLAIVGEISSSIARQIIEPSVRIREASFDLKPARLSPENRDAAIALLDREADRLNRMISDLLTYARPVEVQHEAVDLEALFHTAYEQGVEDPENALSLELKLAPDAMEVEADRKLLLKAITLCFENAEDALGSDDRVTVTSALLNDGVRDYVRVSFSDTGRWTRAVMENNIELVTLPVERDRITRTAADDRDALAFGLIDKIVSAHGGRIRFKTEDERVHCLVDLPRYRPDYHTD